MQDGSSVDDDDDDACVYSSRGAYPLKLTFQWCRLGGPVTGSEKEDALFKEDCCFESTDDCSVNVGDSIVSIVERGGREMVVDWPSVRCVGRFLRVRA